MSTARKQNVRWLFRVWLIAVATLLLPLGAARADEGKGAQPNHRGQIELRAPNGQAGLLELGGGPDLSGRFEIWNVGSGPLRVTRVVVRTSPTDTRTPPGVIAEIEGSVKEAVIGPKQSKAVTVRWMTAAARAKELDGHVIVESDSAGLTGTDGVDNAFPPHPAPMDIHPERRYALSSPRHHPPP